MNSTMFTQFLLNYKTLKTGAFTHTSLGDPVGSFYIPIEKEEQFYKLYSMAVKSGESLYLTEKHKDLCPILLDFDFRYDIVDKLERKYTENHLKKIVQIYVNILNEYFDTDNIKVYLFEKDSPSVYKESEKIAKDGIHIIVPDIVTKPSVQYIMRKKLVSELADYFKEQGFTNSAENIIDEAVIEKNNWLMYGSKKPNNIPYKLTKTYEIENKEIKNVSNSKLSIIETVKLFSIRNKYNEKKIKSDKILEVENYENLLEKSKRNKEIFLQATNKYPSKMNKNHFDNIELVKKFVEILSPKRAEEYDLWIRLGWCLKTIDERLVDSWVSFSKKSDKYVDGECEKLWITMKEQGLGIGTLRMWAKQDNEKAYTEVIRNDWKRYLYKAISRSDYDLAEVVYQMFKYDYKCSSIKDNHWYQFRNHRWEPIDSAYTLRYHLSTDVVNEFMKVITEFTNRAIEEVDPEEKQRYQDKAGKFMKVVNELKTTSKKNNIIKECSVLFYHERFEDLLDSNIHLIGFKNGVYDLELQEFREGRPDDYISFSTNNNYIEYSDNNPLNKDVMEFMNKVMPKPHLCDYLLKCLASFLSGKIKEEKFHIWTGNGSNGKSKLTELFQKAFGDYCGSFNVSMLTQKRGTSSGTNSELVKAKGKRFMILQEPSDNEKLNVGFMKELTGGDKVQARGLYKEPIEFKPQFKMALACNDLPTVPAEDGGTWRRILVLQFLAKFVENPSPRKPFEFKLDDELSEKLELWKETFMSILIKYYRLYLETGIIPPEEVLESTDKYRKENDCYSEFVATRIEFKEKSSVTVSDIYEEFKVYWNQCMPSGKTPSMPEFRKSLERHFGQLIRGSWRGIRMLPADTKFRNRTGDDEDTEVEF